MFRRKITVRNECAKKLSGSVSWSNVPCRRTTKVRLRPLLFRWSPVCPVDCTACPQSRSPDDQPARRHFGPHLRLSLPPRCSGRRRCLRGSGNELRSLSSSWRMAALSRGSQTPPGGAPLVGQPQEGPEWSW